MCVKTVLLKPLGDDVGLVSLRLKGERIVPFGDGDGDGEGDGDGDGELFIECSVKVYRK